MPAKYTNELLEKAYDLIVNHNYSANKTSKELGIDNGTMRKRLKEKYGQIFLPDGKKQINSTFFNKIDTEEKAYWLGFFTADGYVSKTNNIELCLAEVDKKHVEAFKESIKSKHTISKKVAILNDKTFLAYRINIKDKNIANDLRNYGLTNNKSYNAFIPEQQIPNDLIRHYIRGYFDGDGCIFYNKTHSGLYVSVVTASKQMSIDFCNIIKKYIDIDMYCNKRERRDSIIFELRLNKKKDVYRFLSWIYDDSTIYLERKYNKFKNADLGQKSQKS